MTVTISNDSVTSNVKSDNSSPSVVDATESNNGVTLNAGSLVMFDVDSAPPWYLCALLGLQASS